MEAMSLFDSSGAPTLEAARYAAQRGIESALEHANADHHGWTETALEFVRQYAMQHEYFPWYHITMAAENDKDFPKPATGKAYGGICRRAQDEGLIVDSGKTIKHPRRHGVKAAVWRSLIYVGAA